jgi:hypothetical protein
MVLRQLVKQAKEPLPKSGQREGCSRGLGENQQIIRSILHHGLPDDFSNAPLDPVAHDGAAEPPTDQNTKTCSGRLIRAVNHGEFPVFEPTTDTKNRRDLTLISDSYLWPGGLYAVTRDSLTQV